MAYILYSLAFISILCGTLLLFTRAHWLPGFQRWFASLPAPSLPSWLSLRALPGGDYLYSRLPTTFAGDMEAGLSSANFDLGANVEAGDSRAGLDDAAKAEVLRIMKKRRLRFDEARRVYMEQRFSANGIGPDGRPRDPKLVTFS